MYEFRWRDAVLGDEVKVVTRDGRELVLQSRYGRDYPSLEGLVWTDWQDVPYGGSDG